jgi:hypothetical protein
MEPGMVYGEGSTRNLGRYRGRRHDRHWTVWVEGHEYPGAVWGRGARGTCMGQWKGRGAHGTSDGIVLSPKIKDSVEILIFGKGRVTINKYHFSPASDSSSLSARRAIAAALGPRRCATSGRIRRGPPRRRRRSSCR